MAKEEAQEVATVALIENRFVRGTEDVKREVVEVLKFTTTPATVTRGYGITLNLGNYESARLDVSITVPCYVEDIDKADEWARAWVEERVVQEVSSVRGDEPDPSV